MAAQHAWSSLRDEYAALFVKQGVRDPYYIKNLDGFKQIMDDLCRQHATKLLPRMLQKLFPTLELVQSFTVAIGAASQANEASTLVWGASYFLLEIACRYTDTLVETIDYLVSFNQTLPLFDDYIDMFPVATSLRWILMDMYKDYLEYCMDAAKRMKTSSLVTLLRMTLPVAQPKILQAARTKLENHRRNFLEEVSLVTRKRMRDEENQARMERLRIEGLQIETMRRNAQVAAMTAQSLTPHSSRSSTSTLAFPVTTFFDFRNPFFVGRDQILQDLHFHLYLQFQFASNKNISCVTLQGIGGLGKTQTAQEYVHRFKDFYDAVFWIRAEDKSVLADSFSSISETLRITYSSRQNAIDLAKDWLRTTDKRRLLIFDNTESLHDLAPFWPGAKQGAIIITSQRPIEKMMPFYTSISLSSMTREEGTELMFKHLRREPRNHDEAIMAQNLVKEAGGLPLAIATIGGFVHKSASSLTEFASDFDTSLSVWQYDGLGALSPYEKTLANVFRVSLRGLAPDGRALVEILAFLNPDMCPEEIVRLDRRWFKGASESQASGDRFLALLGDLNQRQLVKRVEHQGEKYLSMHRSTQWCILAELDQTPQACVTAFTCAFDMLRANIRKAPAVETVIAAEHVGIYKKLSPQVLSLLKHAKKLWPGLYRNIGFALLLCDMGTYLWQHHLVDDCKLILETAEAIFIELQDPNEELQHSLLRSILTQQLGIMCQTYGLSQRDESLRRRHESLALRQRIADSKGLMSLAEEINYWGAWADLACIHLAYEKYEEAGKIMLQCYPKYQEWGSETEYPFEHAKWWDHYAFVELSKGNVNKCLDMLDHGIRLQKFASGPDGGMVMVYEFSKANLLYACGKTEEALNLSFAVLDRRNRFLGESSYSTLKSLAYTGMLLCERGTIAEAEELLRKCLALADGSGWSRDHVARAQFYLCRTLRVRFEAAPTEELQHEIGIVGRICSEHKTKLAELHPDRVRLDVADEREAYDQMVSIWSGRITGRLVDRNRPPSRSKLKSDGA